MRAFDPDAPVPGLATLELPTTADHDSISRTRRTGTGRSRGPITRLTGADGSCRNRNATPAACAQAAPVKAAPSAAVETAQGDGHGDPGNDKGDGSVDLQECSLERVTGRRCGQPGDGPIHRLSVSAGRAEPERPLSTNCGHAVSNGAQQLLNIRPRAGQSGLRFRRVLNRVPIDDGSCRMARRCRLYDRDPGSSSAPSICLGQ